MKFVQGNKEVFNLFINNLKKDDNILILSHDDFDGLTSALLLKKYLDLLNYHISEIKFMKYKPHMFKDLNLNNVTKIFLLDINADNVDPKGFKIINENYDSLLIDHHPLHNDFKDKDKIIKTSSSDCTALTLFRLIKNNQIEQYYNYVCAAIIADMSYKNPINFKFIKNYYPNITLDTIYKSKPAELSQKISYALIYYKDPKKIFELIANNDLENLDKANKTVKHEIGYWIDKFKSEAEFYKEKKLHLYKISSNYNIGSIVCYILSNEHKDHTYIIASNIDHKYMKISARNQFQTRDMNELLKHCIKDLDDATGGGHVPASGAKIQIKDYEQFKACLLKFLTYLT